ncbi:hypothetical protein FDJ44_gp26 [Microbacterium phage Pikmin]|uniref:Uncharacterized protein n=2 Tax=Pikminvirus pikmin TaxID=2560596 RepID=A0A2P1CKK2_9CAUD|nr:hypothetical protein FDJ44_gp26 [Microbacterium phage Pikmin]AVJ51164.1 hypothetical protein PBI_PIKMIN_26 [Microbacterium phage Pikmin]AVJ51722.1 hypothetical protein PBI_CASEY_26 [Microbacterium phage Casey]
MVTTSIGASQNMGAPWGAFHGGVTTWNNVRYAKNGNIKIQLTDVSPGGVVFYKAVMKIWVCDINGNAILGPATVTKYWGSDSAWVTIGSFTPSRGGKTVIGPDGKPLGAFRLRTSFDHISLDSAGRPMPSPTWGSWTANLYHH